MNPLTVSAVLVVSAILLRIYRSWWLKPFPMMAGEKLSDTEVVSAMMKGLLAPGIALSAFAVADDVVISPVDFETD